MNMRSIEECRNMIDDYARNEGTTWEVMRKACNLSLKAPPTSFDRPLIADASERRAQRLRELSDALAVAALVMNTDVQRTASSLGRIWKSMASAESANAPAGGFDVADEYFGEMISERLWVMHGSSYKGNPTYCPVVRCDGSLQDVYLFPNESHEPTHAEYVNRDALIRYGQSQARWDNNRILRDFYKINAETKQMTGGSGPKKKALLRRRERLSMMSISHETYMRELKKLIARIDSLPINDHGCVSYQTRYSHSQSGYKGRLYAQGVALSKTPKRIRQVAYKGLQVQDWDIQMAYFTFAAQAVEKLQVQINSPYFRLDTVKMYIEDRVKVWESIRKTSYASDAECKQMCNAVFNGWGHL